MFDHFKVMFSIAVFAACAVGMNVSAAQLPNVVVNGVALDAEVQRAIETYYRTPLREGHYWYDHVSGLWGEIGGPSQGQIEPRLKLGRRLDARASVGVQVGITGVFVNGREIHPIELAQLQRLFGPVRRARYWLNARGIGGYEGGAVQWDLRTVAMARRRSAGASGYVRRGPGGSIGSDGSCSYYNNPSSGASVMAGNC
jgi:hypothetical protein